VPFGLCAVICQKRVRQDIAFQRGIDPDRLREQVRVKHVDYFAGAA